MSKTTGKRRADEEEPKVGTNGPLDDVEVSDEHAKLLEDAQKEVERAELAIERQNHITLKQTYLKRRDVLKTIPKFWAVAFHNHPMIAHHIAHKEDSHALSFLEDLWVERDEVEFRAFTIHFHFSQNPFFSDTVLKKEYKYVPPPGNGASSDTPSEDGITQAMLDFDWNRDIDAGTCKINWKDSSKALTKLYPRVVDPEDADDVMEYGSFFNLFEHADPEADIANVIVAELFPDAINFFFGRVDNVDLLDSEDEEEDEDDEDEDEIDLEKPRKKKAKSS